MFSFDKVLAIACPRLLRILSTWTDELKYLDDVNWGGSILWRRCVALSVDKSVIATIQRLRVKWDYIDWLRGDVEMSRLAGNPDPRKEHLLDCLAGFQGVERLKLMVMTRTDTLIVHVSIDIRSIIHWVYTSDRMCDYGP